MMLIYLTIGLSVFGLLLSVYLYVKKRSNTTIYCPFNMKCDAVLRSKYGHVFGFNNELLGILYYLLVLGASIAGITMPNVMPSFSAEVLLSVSGLALTFSVYLFIIQWAVLKKYCSWCILSALLNIGIFLSLMMAFKA